ncbi:cytochrome P450 [Leptodontidium sp. 2 PMI_412]|nr:cytochrome P450 [Leptodontidium sp. 2 PMI_412]
MESPKSLGGRLPSMTTLVATPTGMVVIVFLAVISKIVYQVFFHPLRHIPGPFWAKVFGSYMKVSEARARRAQDLFDLHQKYGSVVRVGKNEVSISTPTVYREIYNSKTILRDPRFYKPKAFIGQGNVFSAIDPNEHTARRKIIAPTFAHQEIIANEGLIVERIEVFIDRILTEVSKSNSVDIFELLGVMTIETICKICFNTNFDPNSDLSYRLLHAIEGAGISFVISSILPLLPKFSIARKLPLGIGKAYQCLDEWQDITAGLLTELKNQQWDEATLRKFNGGPLLLDKNKYLDRHYIFDEAVEESMGLAIAGSGVTQHSLVYLFYALSLPENRGIQQRLREEVSQAGLPFSDVATLPYLTAVIKETHRLYPVIMSTLPRVLQSPLNVPDADITLPPATVVGMQNFVHHRNPEIFLDPLRFVPERWLEGESKLSTDQKLMNAALTPFGTGAYNCIGQTLAKVELYLAVSHFVRRLDFGLNAMMTEDDMIMQDFWAVLPKGRKLLLDVKPLEQK